MRLKQKKRAKKEENLCREHGFMQQTIRIKMWITFYFCGKEHLFVDKHPHFLWFSFAKASKLSTIYQKLPSYPQENKKYKNSKNEKVDKLSTEKRCFFVFRWLNPFKMKKSIASI